MLAAAVHIKRTMCGEEQRPCRHVTHAPSMHRHVQSAYAAGELQSRSTCTCINECDMCSVQCPEVLGIELAMCVCVCVCVCVFATSVFQSYLR